MPILYLCSQSRQDPTYSKVPAHGAMHISMLSFSADLCSAPFLGACSWVNSLSSLSLTVVIVPALQK